MTTLVYDKIEQGSTIAQKIRVRRPSNLNKTLTVASYRPHLIINQYLTEGTLFLRVYDDITGELLQTASRSFDSLNASKKATYTHGYFYMVFDSPGLNINFLNEDQYKLLRIEFNYDGYIDHPTKYIGLVREYENRKHDTVITPPNANVSPYSLEEFLYKEA